MSINVFLGHFREAVELENAVNLTAETPLSEVPGWDSLAILSVMAMASTIYEKVIVMEDIERCKKVGDLFEVMQAR
ncbi:hypothetical protein HEQ60_09375 [Haematospirillum sp. H1815]|uniref:hypothetical protein n=1 Tax=Haematospirillum sp. H1815 TaxID=2723108 RepID=UPI001439AEE9|nr:hypothetical protein [Haematospirillum sp. H1815]NKD77967.1 hypothetical protein [Haematospirillum sp. H1815]